MTLQRTAAEPADPGGTRRRPWQSRFRYPVILLWLLLMVAAAPFAAKGSTNLTGGGFNAPDSASGTVTGVIDRDYPAITESPLGIVLRPTESTRPGDLVAAVGEVRGAVADVPGLSIPPPVEQAAAAQATQAPKATLVLQLQSTLDDQEAIDAAASLRDRFGVDGEQSGSIVDDRVRVSVIGQGALWSAMQDLSEKAATEAEMKGFPVIALVLFLVFGCLAAMLLPLVLGAGAVITTTAILFGLSLVMEISIFATNVTSMIGIGVAVDYSLFVLARYRQAVSDGVEHDDAISLALRTSGRAVYFSGLTVVLSLLTVYLIDSAALRSLALGAIVVVAVAVLATATLLPAMLAVLGPRRLATGRLLKRLQRLRQRRDRSGFWERWAAAVMRRPVTCIVLSSLLMITLAIPAFQLNIRSDAGSQLPAADDASAATQAAADVVGPGALGPVYVLVRDADKAGSATTPEQALTTAVGAVLAKHATITGQPTPAANERSTLFTAVLDVAPESEEARETVEALRTELAGLTAQPGQILVGGATATLMDFDELVTSSLLWMFVLILVLAFAVLFVLLRSIVLPLKAILMNLLSVGASYGAVVAAFQWGWLEFLGMPHSPAIDTIVPPLVLVVAFGLSMDYEVFLLTRIRERYDEKGDTGEAVQHALATSATPITSAALIMVAVFLAFVSSGMPTIQRLGFALTVAIVLDATIVRLVLVPAAMAVLGRWNWWLPRSLDAYFDKRRITISH